MSLGAFVMHILPVLKLIETEMISEIHEFGGIYGVNTANPEAWDLG